MNIKVLRPEDADKIRAFELKRLEKTSDDEMEREMATWNARWRQEALDHYLPLGWSFAVWRNETELEGYFIAQPQLFTGGLTQALWVEHLAFDSDATGTKLIEVAYKTAREKHLQRVIYSGLKNFTTGFENLKTENMEEDLTVIKTAKYKG